MWCDDVIEVHHFYSFRLFENTEIERLPHGNLRCVVCWDTHQEHIEQQLVLLFCIHEDSPPYSIPHLDYHS